MYAVVGRHVPATTAELSRTFGCAADQHPGGWKRSVGRPRWERDVFHVVVAHATDIDSVDPCLNPYERACSGAAVGLGFGDL